MTTTNHPDITLTRPEEVIASIPALLGFHPTDSLVVLGMRGAGATELTLVLRTDLPPPQRLRDTVHALLPPLVQHGTAGVALVVIGGGPPDDPDLPQRELVARCESILADVGIAVLHQLWVPTVTAGSRWRCYDEDDCTGLLPDPADTDLNELAESAGLSIHDRREDIVATLTPEPDDVLDRRAKALNRHSTETEPNGEDTTPPTDRMHALLSAIEAARTTPPKLTDDDVVELTAALSDHRIRDLCLDFEDLPDATAAERLWTALARATPAPERAEAACLLAFSAYARGDGVLAGIALHRAEEADPGHRLTALLRGALTVGLSPTKLRIAGIKAATQARRDLAENRT